MSTKSLTQLEHCRILLGKHGHELRYVVDTGEWLQWTGHWERRKDTALTPLVVASFEQMQLEAARDRDADREMKIRAREHRGHIDAVIDLLSREPRLQVTRAQLDSDPHLIGVANGVIDLRTGALVEETPEMLLTKRSSVRFDSNADRTAWATFVGQIFGEQPEVMDYVQRVVGYCLTGCTDVQEMWLLVGAGSNGKSTFLSTLLKCLGEYGQQAGEAVLLDRARPGAPAPEMTRLQGARLAVLSESEQGVRLNEARMKALVSADLVTARALYQDVVEFRPQAKFMLATNHLPSVMGTDDGVWRRLSVIPFAQKFVVNGDRTLGARLEAALPGVLAWAVEGAVAWYGDGQLTRPEAIERASSAYRNREDILGAFLRSHFAEGGHVMAAEFREMYEAWCVAENVEPIDANSIGSQMRQRNYRSEPYGKHRRSSWKGLSVKPSQPAESEDIDDEEVR